MARILFVFYSDIDKEMVYKTFEEHNHHFNSVLNYDDDLDQRLKSRYIKKI